MGSASSVLSTVKSPSFITGVGLGLGIAAGYINFFQKQISDAIPTDDNDNDSAGRTFSLTP